MTSNLVLYEWFSQLPFWTMQPPPSFLATMEEYIKEAPQTGSVNNRLVRKCVHMVMAFLAYIHAFDCDDLSELEAYLPRTFFYKNKIK